MDASVEDICRALDDLKDARFVTEYDWVPADEGVDMRVLLDQRVQHRTVARGLMSAINRYLKECGAW